MGRIPCHIVELDDREAFEVSLVENVQHETMNPIDEARAFKRYVDDYGYGGVSELARKIGKSQEYVSRRVQLLSLPKKIREEVMRRRITSSAAQELASLDDKDANEVVEIIHEQHLSMREVRRIVKHHRQTSQQQQGEPSSYDLDAHHPDASERRTRRIDRALARAVASLRMDTSRLSDLIDDVEDEGEDEDEWVVRELLFQCRRGLNEQMENLLRFRKRLMRAGRAAGRR